MSDLTVEELDADTEHDLFERMARAISTEIASDYDTSTPYQRSDLQYAAKAALAVAKPMIERELLRELLAYRLRIGQNRWKMVGGHAIDVVEAFVKERGIDLEPKP